MFALTRALLHLADRIAWLAILRAPWCGLTLNDLAALTASVVPVDGVLMPDPRTVWEMINDAPRLETLSTDGRQRIEKIRNVLHMAIQTRRRAPLRDAVEQCWLALSKSILGLLSWLWLHWILLATSKVMGIMLGGFDRMG